MSPIELKVAEASRKTIEALHLQGMNVNQNYGYDAPSLPADITGLMEEQVMDLYTKYVAYLEFINLQLWCAEVDKAEADKNLSLGSRSVITRVHSLLFKNDCIVVWL